ncbi:MAG: hypothetical protein HRU32_02285 [Rhodobacteraceae bacterium]|nr:hypothetical protein [Paracoccaceae bacterium]
MTQTEIILHIGAPKTGTTALQRFLKANPGFLSDHEANLVAPAGKGSINALAVAIRNGKNRVAERLGTALCEALANTPTKRAILSSELLWNAPSDAFARAMPLLKTAPLRIVAYLNRPDRAVEALFKHSAKNGRFTGSLDEWITTNAPGELTYEVNHAQWSAAFPHATWSLRPFSRAQLTGGDIIDDFTSLLGISDIPSEIRPSAIANATPPLDALLLLQSAAAAGIPESRRIQRALARSEAGAKQHSGRILPRAEALRILENAAPTLDWLDQHSGASGVPFFATDDLDQDYRVETTSFSDEQLRLIGSVFSAIARTLKK